MTISLKHPFESAKSDGADNTIVQPSDWNAEHTLTLAADSLLGRTSGAGAVQEITCTSAGRALLDDANAAAQVTTLGLDGLIPVTAFDSATQTDNPHNTNATPPLGQALDNMSVTVNPSVETMYEISFHLTYTKSSGFAGIYVYDGSTKIGPVAGGPTGAYCSMPNNQQGTDARREMATFRATLAAGSHTITLRHVAITNTNSCVFYERYLSVVKVI